MSTYLLHVKIRNGGEVFVRQPFDDDGHSVYEVERFVMARYTSARSVEAIERDGVPIQSGTWKLPIPGRPLQ